MPSRRWHRLGWLGPVGLMVAVCLAGCYQKVVGATGFGADQVTIERGNLPDSTPRSNLGYREMQHKPIPPRGR